MNLVHFERCSINRGLAQENLYTHTHALRERERDNEPTTARVREKNLMHFELHSINRGLAFQKLLSKRAHLSIRLIHRARDISVLGAESIHIFLRRSVEREREREREREEEGEEEGEWEGEAERKRWIADHWQVNKSMHTECV